jgi:hypothetical protein
MNSKNFPIFKKDHLSLLATILGVIEVLTGFFIIIWPQLIYNLLLLGQEPCGDEVVLLRWIGCFVGGVGCSYFMIAQQALYASLWFSPCVARMVVALFLFSAFACGSLPWTVLGIALYDGIVALHHVIWMLRLRKSA